MRRLGRPLSIRALLLTLTGAVGLYLVFLSAFAVIPLALSARAASLRAGTVSAQYDALHGRAITLETAFTAIEQLADRGPAHDQGRISGFRAVINQLAETTLANWTTTEVAQFPPGMRAALAEAAGSETELAGVLLEALADIEAGDAAAARRWLATADEMHQQLLETLAQAQRIGLMDIAKQQEELGTRADVLVRNVILWLIGGTALALLVALLLHRWLFGPIARLEQGLSRVAEGDLDTSLPMGRDDEIGRLNAHFNEMTDVLRSRPEVEALRVSEIRFRSLIENGMDLTAILDVDGTLRYITPSVKGILGYEPEEMIGMGLLQVHPDDRIAAGDALARAAASPPGVPVRNDFRFLHRDGSWRAFEGVITNLLSEPTVAGLVVNSRDITKRRKALEALERSRENFAHIFRQAPVAIALVHFADGRILDVNEKFVSLFGFPRDEVIGSTGAEVGLWPDEEERDAFVREIRSDETRETELRFRPRDGRELELLAAYERLELDGEPVLLVTLTDVTEQRHNAREVRNSEGRLRAAFMASSDAYVIVKVDGGVIVEVNDQFLSMYGFTHDEIVGRTSVEAGLWVDPEVRAEIVAELTRAGFVSNWPVRARRKDGEIFPVLYSVRLLPASPDGSALYLGVIRDVSEQQRSAEAIRNLEAQFRQAQRLEAVGRLAAGVAHDFNNVLTVIYGFSDMLYRELDEDDQRRADVEEVRKAAQRGTALTRQLLAFSRKQVLEPRILDLNESIRDLEKMLGRLLGEDIAMAFAPGEDLGAVLADPGQVEQVVLNLVVNARDAMPNGGELLIETANVELTEAEAAAQPGAAAGRYVMLAVQDTGTGMNAETLAHIFEPFFTTKEQGRGTGLGLSTVHGIVTQSGGFLMVTSIPGKGSTFRIFLPFVDAAIAMVEQQPVSATASEGRGETVLIAEDDPAVRVLAERVLRKAGYNLLLAPDGETALALARANASPIDLLLTDCVMPGMGGPELAAQLQSQQPGLRVIYMSGYTDDEVVRAGVRTTGHAMMQKPFTPPEIAEAVRRMLDAPVPA